MFANRLTSDMYPQGKKVNIESKPQDHFRIGWENISTDFNSPKLKSQPKEIEKHNIQGQYNISNLPPEQLDKLLQHFDKKQRQVRSRSSQASQIEVRSSLKRESTIESIIKGTSEYSSPQSYKKSERNRSSFALGDGYNFFKQANDVPQMADFHSRIVDLYKYNKQNEKKRISNIEFG